MKKISVLLSAAASLPLLGSTPIVSGVETSQSESSRRVTVSYSVSSLAIVTPCVQTNNGTSWIDVGDQYVQNLVGDINKRVGEGRHTFTWRPDKSWPDIVITDKSFRIGVKAWTTEAPPAYMVLNLLNAGVDETRWYASAEALPGGVTNDLYKTDCLVMRLVPAANVTARIGSPSTETGRVSGNDEKSIFVTFTNDYYLGVYPVTQRQYLNVRGLSPSYFTNVADGPTRPVDSLSWWLIRGNASTTPAYNWPSGGHDVNPDFFLGRLRKHVGAGLFDLPSEAEWEYACRAGCGAALYNGQELESTTVSSTLDAIARYYYNGGYVPNGSSYAAPDATCDATHGSAKVGSKSPNAWGFYDMLGNVWEWCLDWKEAPMTGVGGPSSGTLRVLRGGCWAYNASNARCAYRRADSPGVAEKYYGFRVWCPAGL